MEVSTFRSYIQDQMDTNGDTWDDVVYSTLPTYCLDNPHCVSDPDLHDELVEHDRFVVWTRFHVYYSYYAHNERGERCGWVSSVPRNPAESITTTEDN